MSQSELASEHEKKLDTILRHRGLAWAIDMFAPQTDAIAHYLKSLEALEKFVGDRRLGTNSFSPDTLEHLLHVAPYKADAFLQALVSIRSTEILCAAWRILQGMDIENIELTYTRLSDFRLFIRLRSPYGQFEDYESSDINDAVFMRHIGKTTVDGKPLFDGFYALRQT